MPSIHGKKHSYSLLKAVRDCSGGGSVTGLEAEVHEEVARRAKRIFKGFAIPTSSDPELWALMYPNLERRDLTTTTGAGAIFTHPESFADMLRARLVVASLGAQILTGISGQFAIPRKIGGDTVQWVGEGVSVTPSSPSFDDIPFAPKLAIASTVVTKLLVMQTSLDVDKRLNDELSKVLALAFDAAVINGGGGAQPLGLLNDPIIQSLSAGLAIGPNGSPMTYARAVAMDTLVSNANAAPTKMAFLINPTTKGALKNTPVGTAGYPPFVYGKGSGPGVGEIACYPVRDTTLVPNNLTKGTSTNCSAVILGNWEDLTVATWDTGIDMIVDPFTGKRAGGVEITMEMAMDSHPDHEASFAILTDVTPS